MPKWKSKYEDGRKYSATWEKTFVWCKKFSDTSEDAFCKLCFKSIQPKLSSLKKHEESAGHQQRIPKTQPTISSGLNLIRTQRETNKISGATKAAEIELAVTILCHSAIQSVDHFNDFLKKKYGENSTAGNVRLRRSKCAALIKNVVTSAFKKEMINELNCKPYALLIDEFTDVGTTKLLCICVRYVSLKKKEIGTIFSASFQF